MADKHGLNEVVRRSVERVMLARDALRAEFGTQLGAEEVGLREVRGLIRRSLAGDEAAFNESIALAAQQPDMPGAPKGLNGVIIEMDEIMRNEQGGE